MNTCFLFIGGIGLPEIFFIALIVLLLFGGKKIPELMRGLGQGIRSFKNGMNETDNSDKQTSKDSQIEKEA